MFSLSKNNLTVWGLLPRLLAVFIALQTLSLAPSGYAEEKSATAETILKASRLKSKAEIKDARFLAPKLYQQASDLLNKAQLIHKEKPESKSITKTLNKSIQLFVRAIAASKIASDTLADVVAARRDAVGAQAIDYANKEWSIATEALHQLTNRIAKEKTIDPDKLIETESLFREAELIAIKNNYLTETRDRIALASSNKSTKYAPTLLNRAAIALQEAESALDTNRYDTDKPRLIARQAKIDAGHANRIALEALAVKKGDRSYEQLILSTEEPIHDIAESLDLAIALDEGTGKATLNILERINFLKEDSLRLVASQEEIQALQSQVNQLQAKLGSTSTELAEQAAFRARLQEAETIFLGEEARVYRQEGNIRISAYGFTFKEGGSELQADQTTLLKKIMQTIRLFPGCSITVEGHTDSFGSDKFNLELSMDRASSVGDYLSGRKKPLGFRTIETKGFGETQPIANNETASGRAKNRRIEIVISGIK